MRKNLRNRRRLFGIKSDTAVWVSPYNGEVVVSTGASQVAMTDGETEQLIAELSEALNHAPAMRAEIREQTGGAESRGWISPKQTIQGV